MIRLSAIYKLRFMANDLAAWVPNFWAMESLKILDEKLFAPNLFHRDFSALVADKGDVVNTRRPSTYTFNRKSDADASVTFQDTTATNVAVPLNQHIEVTCKIRDIEWSKGLPQMFETHIAPMATALSRFADAALFGQVYQFLANSYGSLGGLTDTNAKDYILKTREKMNRNKAYEDNRQLVLSVGAETQMLRPQMFVSVDKRGDNLGLKEAYIGRAFQFDFSRSNNMPEINAGNTVIATGAINLAAGYAAGSKVFVVDGLGAAYLVGSWVTIDGMPDIVVASTTTALTVKNGISRAVADNAVIVNYTPGAINNGAGYAIGYDKEITIDGFTVAPQVGQAISFTIASPLTAPIYTILKVNGLIGVTLDRPLEGAVVDNDTVNIGPAGGFNFAFHQNCMAVVNRALAIPDASMGVKAASASSNNGLSLRLIMQYNASGQFTQVTMDMLFGLKILDVNLGAVLLS